MLIWRIPGIFLENTRGKAGFRYFSAGSVSPGENLFSRLSPGKHQGKGGKSAGQDFTRFSPGENLFSRARSGTALFPAIFPGIPTTSPGGARKYKNV